MSYEENIDVAAQRIKSFSFDVVSDIQSKISSLNLILNETQDLELKNQISATLNQLQNQMTLVLSNTMALTETILGYKELLGNHIFSDEVFLSSIGSGKEAKPVIEKPETTSVDVEVKPAIEAPVEEKSADSLVDAEVKPIIEAPIEEKPEAPSVDVEVKPDIELAVEEKPETPSIEAEVKQVIEAPVEEKPADSLVDVEVKPDIELAVEEKPETPSIEAEVKQVIEAPVEEKPADSLVDVEVKPDIELAVEEKPETPSVDAEVKPVIEVPVEEKSEAPSVDAEVKLITDSIDGEKEKNGDSIEIMSIADGDSSTIADSDVSNDTTTISASPAQMSSSGSEEGEGPFRIGESLATESISTLDNNNNNTLGELTFLLKNSTPRAIVVTFEQFNKLQNSCQEQASKLVFDDVTEENLEEMMTNLPSLYEINPDEAEKLSAKITAKLQELENKE